MSVHEEQTGRDGWFVTAAAAVGDLGHAFYREERQRDVWNEASAVGLQVALWLGTALAAAMVLIGGAAGLPYALAVLVLIGVASAVSLHYAQCLGVDVTDAVDVMRWRLVPHLVLLAVFVAGVVRAAPPAGFFHGVALGAPVGMVAGVVVLVLGSVRAQRRARRAGG